VTAPARRPVLLVPGWSDTARVLRRCRADLVSAGWPDEQVRALSFRDRYGSNIEHAGEIEHAAATLARAAGTDRIAVVAHSMGGLALRRFLLDGGDAVVDTAIFVGTPHRGTWVAWLAWGRGGAEMRPGSAFLRGLNAAPLPTSVRAICLRTPIDTRILPGSSAFLPDADCHTVRLPTHPGMLRHGPTLRLIRDLLLDERARAA
jgi:pimeloyl-ACP methyl ester carboxylesterase